MKNLNLEQLSEITGLLKSAANDLQKLEGLIKSIHEEDSVHKDYEILSFENSLTGDIRRRGVTDDLFYSQINHFTMTEKELFLPEVKFWIHSVRRLPDGEVFTIGDMVSRGDVVSPIAKMEVRMGSLMVSCANDINSSVSISLLKKVPNRVPLFKTGDGKDVFIGDVFYYIGDALNVCETKCLFSGYGIFAKFKTFSTRELAEEYVAINKPCLSVNDVQKLITYYADKNVGWSYVNGRIKELAKSKL